MITVTCFEKDKHKSANNEDFSIHPFDDENAVCLECKYEASPEWHLERVFFVSQIGDADEDYWKTEKENYSNWVVLQYFKRNLHHQLQTLRLLAADASGYTIKYWHELNEAKIKKYLQDWARGEQFKEALLKYAGFEIDDIGRIVKQKS